VTSNLRLDLPQLSPSKASQSLGGGANGTLGGAKEEPGLDNMISLIYRFLHTVMNKTTRFWDLNGVYICEQLSVLDNGNFREFFVERGEFYTFETGIPGGPGGYAIWVPACANLLRQEVRHRWSVEAGVRRGAGVARTATALHWWSQHRTMESSSAVNRGSKRRSHRTHVSLTVCAVKSLLLDVVLKYFLEYSTSFFAISAWIRRVDTRGAL